MADVSSRINKVIGELSGNETLLEMLDSDAATELLNWGIATATTLVQKTASLDDAAAELILEPQLKAIRQTMRSAGNWAAGKYVDPASRAQLREKLDENFMIIFGEDVKKSLVNRTDIVLSQVNDKNKTPMELIQSFKSLSDEMK
jgi:hypothetical protein